MRPGLQADMAECGGHGQGTLAVVDGAVHIARRPKIDAHLGVDVSESQVVAERLGQGLGTTQMIEHPLGWFSQGIERGT